MKFKQIRWANRELITYTTTCGVTFSVTSQGHVSYKGVQLQRVKEGDHFYVDIEGLRLDVAVLVAMIWRGSKLSLQQLSEIIVRPIQWGGQFFIPSNLAPRCYPDTETFWIEHKGIRYKMMPYYSRYAMSTEGRVLDMETMQVLSYCLNEREEVCYRVYSDSAAYDATQVVRAVVLMMFAHLDFPMQLSSINPRHTGKLWEVPTVKDVELVPSRQQEKPTGRQTNYSGLKNWSTPEEIKKRQAVVGWPRPSLASGGSNDVC